MSDDADPRDDDAAPGGPPSAAIDWESFYANYRKPGYVPGYEILEKLGAGVFGVVFKARKESIGKLYAIKFLKVDDDAVRDAVLRELDSVKYFAQVDHPNLVSIEDQGEVDGIPFIVMAYAGDSTLRRRIDDDRPDRDEALGLFVQVARGVHALHERSLVHFDLKPANVYLKGDVARVGDYGLSKLVSQSRNSLSFGRGTPYYMAPEMLRRHGDHRSDIYSLGIILFELLVGEPPFRGDSEWEVLKKHEEQPPQFPPGISSTDRAVLSRCLAKQPEDRYGSVRELLDELEGAARPAAAAAAAASARATANARTNEPPRDANPIGEGGGPRHAFRTATATAAAARAGRHAPRGRRLRPDGKPFSRFPTFSFGRFLGFAFVFWVVLALALLVPVTGFQLARRSTMPSVPRPAAAPSVTTVYVDEGELAVTASQTRSDAFDPDSLADLPAPAQLSLAVRRQIEELVEDFTSCIVEVEHETRLALAELGDAIVPDLINALGDFDYEDADEHRIAFRVNALLENVTGESMGFVEPPNGNACIEPWLATRNAQVVAKWHRWWNKRDGAR